ncbi:hypothetical protein CFC21_016452, partial [Triticum aestivum]
MDRAELTTEQ